LDGVNRSAYQKSALHTLLVAVWQYLGMRVSMECWGMYFIAYRSPLDTPAEIKENPHCWTRS